MRLSPSKINSSCPINSLKRDNYVRQVLCDDETLIKVAENCFFRRREAMRKLPAKVSRTIWLGWQVELRFKCHEFIHALGNVMGILESTTVLAKASKIWHLWLTACHLMRLRRKHLLRGEKSSRYSISSTAKDVRENSMKVVSNWEWRDGTSNSLPSAIRILTICWWLLEIVELKFVVWVRGDLRK